MEVRSQKYAFCIAGVTLALLVYVFLLRGAPSPVIVLRGDHVISYATENCNAATRFFRENDSFIVQQGCAAITSCPEMTRLRDACSIDPTIGARTYIDRVATAFAVEKECHGVSVIIEEKGSPAKHGSESAIGLLIDYYLAAQIQSWSLINFSSLIGQGEGDPEHIATTSCQLSREVGAYMLR